MSNLKNQLISSLKWIWQFPQNMLALCMEGVLCSAATRGSKSEGNQLIICDTLPGEVSLGDYIFIHSDTTKKSIKHECGHSKQSDKLGPLYLLIIGIPSLLHNLIYYIFGKFGITWDYYKFYTEYWLMK